MHPILNIAQRAALAAGKIGIQFFEKRDKLTIEHKADRSLVSQADMQMEMEIRHHIQAAFPNHAICGEEMGWEGNQQHDTYWMIDPLDGTNNFLHGIAHFAISIAYVEQGKMTVGIVYDPIKNEIFTAARGRGARLNDRRLRVNTASRIDQSLLSTSFPVAHANLHQQYLKGFNNLVFQTRQVRSLGSAALDLAYVACGRLDGFWSMGLKPWDIAAGSLLVTEAGGLVSDLSGGHEYLNYGDIAATNPKLLKPLLQAVQ